MLPGLSHQLGGLVFLTSWPLLAVVPGNPITVDGITYSTNMAGAQSDPYRAHDLGGVDLVHNSSGVGTAYWRVQFESYRRMTELQIAAAAGNVATWKLQGSTDATAWTDLVTGVLSNSTTTYPITSPQPYLYYQMLCTAVTDVARLGNVNGTFSQT